jgi:putative transposase
MAHYPKINLSKRHPDHKIYPYLLRGLKINEKDHVWSTDITYIRLTGGFVYLMAIIDWGTRFVLDWELSTTMEADFCIETLRRTLETNKPEIFNTDQGSQFTSPRFTGLLLEKDIKISMDGRGRALDNVFVERLWRSVKQEKVYLSEFRNVREARAGINEYFDFYNHRRIHQSLDYKTPAEVYRA